MGLYLQGVSFPGAGPGGARCERARQLPGPVGQARPGTVAPRLSGCPSGQQAPDTVLRIQIRPDPKLFTCRGPDP